MATTLAVINENGCIAPFSLPAVPGTVLYYNGTDLVWLECDCSGNGTGGGGGGSNCPCLTSAALDAAGKIVLTMDNGTTINTGVVAANRPFRVAGPLGANGSLDQPGSENDVNVTADIQHIGKVLIGGVVGSMVEEELHVKGYILVEEVDPEIELRRTDTTGPLLTSMFMRHYQGAQMDNNVFEIVASLAANMKGRIVTQSDRLSNFGIGDALRDGTNAARNVLHFVDDRTLSNARDTIPTLTPVGPYNTSHYALHITV